MAVNDAPTPEPMPWDRLGLFWEDLFTVGRTMAQRNLDVWSSMAQNLRKDTYKADDMSTDAAKAMSSAMANVQDLWDLWIRFPERERVATTLPTAFLLFQQNVIGDKVLWSCEEPVWLRLPSSSVEQYPPHPEIELTGPDPQVAEALKACLGTELGPSRQAYRLYVKDLKSHRLLFKPGIYSGSIYVKQPTPCLVANLRIVLEGDAPSPGPQDAATVAGPADAPAATPPAAPPPAAPSPDEPTSPSTSL